MNLNELCLLNFLKNPNELNDLSVMIGELYINNAEKESIEQLDKNVNECLIVG